VTIVLKSGNLNLLESSGPLKACNGIALPLPVLCAGKEIGIEVLADVINCKIVCRGQNAVKKFRGNGPFAVTKFQYLGTSLTNQNYVHEEIELRGRLLLFCTESSVLPFDLII
jgi:hypothetical protein